MFRRQQQAAQIYTNWRNSIPQGVDMNELKETAPVFSVSDTALGLPAALASAKADSDASTAHVNDLINSQRVGDDVSSHLAAQRFWAHSMRTLEAIKDGAKVVAAARELINSASASQVPVLTEEMSSYLASRSMPTGWLPAAYAAAIPGLTEATTAAGLKARQYAVLAQNHHVLTNAFAKGIAAGPLLDPAQVSAAPYSDVG
jgi:hypothetical protein